MDEDPVEIDARKAGDEERRVAFELLVRIEGSMQSDAVASI